MIEPSPHKLPGNIFMQPWWLDVVAKDDWIELKIEKGGDLKARWPIVMRKKMGFVHIEMPVLTQKTGPWIKQESTKQVSLHSNERKLLEELIEKIPSFDRFNLNLDESIINYLPFKWSGFKQSSNTSFRINDPYNSEAVWANFKSTVRRNIRRAQENCTISTNLTSKELYLQIKKTFHRKNKEPSYSFELIDDLINEATKRNRANIIGVLNKNNEVISAQLFIHDDNVTYYLAGGFDNDNIEPGAVSLGMFEGIRLAAARKNAFDFEGSSVNGIEQFFSSFGSIPIHFHNIHKVSNKYLPVYLLKEIRNFRKTL
ncbi:MAG: GNAT family N-acetyltransferase [Balneolaceae bacterium]|nr:GNAT family N-acetyltransferase [Balneolaceae bacterium]